MSRPDSVGLRQTEDRVMQLLIVTLVWGIICALVAVAALNPASKKRNGR